jgi:2-polyprenyl-3-methyl-5-hydroxy-6-metoxy-1,4-benzoquinol methylase
MQHPWSKISCETLEIEKMNETVESLYDSSEYPAMSHPVAHPSAMAASALLSGLRSPTLQNARILEIGCAQGHHISPMALRWPDAQFTAIDYSASAIAVAKRVASEANVTNVEFIQADVRDWQIETGRYDYVIAHGVLSWVDDACKAALLRLCCAALSPQGVAMISYNVLPGWMARQSLAQMTRALQNSSLCQGSAMTALEFFDDALKNRLDPYGSRLHQLVRDSIKKGLRTLAFDDLAPINDPCYFSQFFQWISQSGLRYLGESDMGLEHPDSLTKEMLEQTSMLHEDPLLQQQAMDFMTGRCFRTSLICLPEAEVRASSVAEVMQLCVEQILPIPACGEMVPDMIAGALAPFDQGSVRLERLYDSMEGIDHKTFLAFLSQQVALGSLRFTSHEFLPTTTLPQSPKLNKLNQIYLRNNRTVIDRLHKPCVIAAADAAFLSQCDGSVGHEELLLQHEASTRKRMDALMKYMNARGIFEWD